MSDGDFTLCRAAISLGSNICPEEHLTAAVRELSRAGDLLKVSQVWESPPAGFRNQANFFNAAVLLAGPFSKDRLKPSVLRPIEDRLGRIRDPENINAPRTIDLDLSIFFSPQSPQVLDDEILTRAFVAVPLAEILPDFVHPETGRTLREIARDLQSTSPEIRLRTDCRLNESVPPTP